MKLFITSIKRITTTTPETLFVRVGCSKDSDSGYIDAKFEVEIKNMDFMSMSLTEIESLAISRAEEFVGQ